MKPKEVKVKCSYCGNEMNCPENMLNSEKHACFECFKKLENEIENIPDSEAEKIHVEMPKDKVPEYMASKLMEEVFPHLWKEKKAEIRSMSKSDIAKNMFAAGAMIMARSMIEDDEHDEG